MHLAVFPPLSWAFTLPSPSYLLKAIAVKMSVSLKSSLFHPCSRSPCLCCQSSLWIYAIIDPPVVHLWAREQQRACALLSSPVHTILQHIIGATSQNLDLIHVSFCFKEHVQGHSLTKFLPCLKLFGFQEQASRRGRRAARTGWDVRAASRHFSRCLSLVLKFTSFKKNGCPV